MDRDVFAPRTSAINESQHESFLMVAVSFILNAYLTLIANWCLTSDTRHRNSQWAHFELWIFESDFKLSRCFFYKFLIYFRIFLLKICTAFYMHENHKFVKKSRRFCMENVKKLQLNFEFESKFSSGSILLSNIILGGTRALKWLNMFNIRCSHTSNQYTYECAWPAMPFHLDV